MRVSATAKYLRGSTRKARLVTQAIKGKPVEEAALTAEQAAMAKWYSTEKQVHLIDRCLQLRLRLHA